MVQSQNEDSKIIIKNLIEHLRDLQTEVREEIPFLTELLDDLNIEHIQPNEPVNYQGEVNMEETSETSTPGPIPTRVIIHGHHPDECDTNGKLIHLPESVEDLLKLAEKKLGKRGSTVVMADGSQVEELNALRDNDRLFIF